MAKVLVTGASGFIGQHIVREFLSQGHDVTCLVRKTSRLDDLQKLGASFFESDIRDASKLNQAIDGKDIVIHLAGLTKSFEKDQLFQINEKGTQRVANACASRQTPPKLIYMSSLAAVGPAPRDAGRTESDPYEPVSNYGRSKLAGEQVLREYSDRVSISILRPGIVLGQGDKDGFEIFRGAAFGVIVVPSLRDRIFSIVHASDLAKAVRVVANKGERLGEAPEQGTYLVSGREEWTFAELGQKIGESLGLKRVRPLYHPDFVIWAAGAVYEFFSRVRKKTYIMNMDKAREATAGAWHCNSEKLLNLGFDPEPLQQRINETIDWYIEKGWLKAKGKINPPHRKIMHKHPQANG